MQYLHITDDSTKLLRRRCFALPGPDFVLQKIPLERSKVPTMCRVRPGVCDIFLFIYYVHYFYMFHVLYKLYITVTENQSD